MARPVTVNIPHSLGKEEARRRVEQGTGQLQQQLAGSLAGMLKFTERWEGDRLNFQGGGLGQTISGRIDVLADSLHVEVDLPEMLAALADRISAALKKEGQKLLEKK